MLGYSWQDGGQVGASTLHFTQVCWGMEELPLRLPDGLGKRPTESLLTLPSQGCDSTCELQHLLQA